MVLMTTSKKNRMPHSFPFDGPPSGRASSGRASSGRASSGRSLPDGPAPGRPPPPRHLPVAKAKATFSEQIRAVEHGRSVVITRRGKPVVAMVPIEDLESLARLRARGPGGGLASLVGGWDGSGEVVEGLAANPRQGERELPRIG
ncbi:MAG: type II toxin-antitoxin system prevent-host-death family antitoxin [Longimicrobiales bacterium]|nr:type II toxin-antitoxin system prevent-host-death family antitoxin [Longimicrobiales bacterium]